MTPAIALGEEPTHFAGDRLVGVRLYAEHQRVAPGGDTWLAVAFSPRPGWHIYWRNPGDSGAPPSIAWSLPQGVTVGASSWPVPERIVSGGIATFVYSRPATLLVPLHVSYAVMTGRNITVAAHFSWLVCAHVCVPGRGHARLIIDNVAQSAIGTTAGTTALFAAARAALPVPAPPGATLTEDARTITVSVPSSAFKDQRVTGATFFPYDGAPFAQSAPQRFDDGTSIGVTLMRNPAAHALASHFVGVLRADVVKADGHRQDVGLLVDATPAAFVMSEAPLSILAAIALAFAGGIVLNVMPCVFPVLSFKALGVVSDHAPRKRRRLAAAYATGVIFSASALGVALLVLRGAGQALGWGFQWQSPVFVGLLALLIFVLALSLSGVVEIVVPLPAALAQRGERHGTLSSFADGALVALVASSCTAPFMGSALGFALTASPLAALAVFVALGAGIAVPYVLVTSVPAVAARLPRPGPWMLAARRLFAFPLYATVAWLVWVFAAQTSSNALLALLFALVIAGFGASAFGSAQSSTSWPRTWNICGIAAAIIAVLLVAPVRTVAHGNVSSAGDALHFETYSSGRLATLRSHKQRTFVDLTAAWCITCQVNDRLALSNAAVGRRFSDLHVTLLRGDWTNQDPEITAYLQQFGRSGVPLYAYYPADGSVEVWPQLLTPNIVLNRLRDT
jgi:thiol:disulfide interchange protein DsbD